MCKYKQEDFKDIKELRFTRTAKDSFHGHTFTVMGELMEEALQIASLDLIDGFAREGTDATKQAMLIPTIPSRAGMQPLCAIHICVQTLPDVEAEEDIVLMAIRDKDDPLELVVTAIWNLSYYKYRRSQTGTNGGARVKTHYAGIGPEYRHPDRSFNPIKFETEALKNPIRLAVPAPIQTVPETTPEPEAPAPVQTVQAGPQEAVNYNRNYLVIANGIHKTIDLDNEVKSYIDSLVNRGTPPDEIIVFQRKHLRVSISF